MASFATNANGKNNTEAVFSWDDYMEHEPSREVVEIHRIWFIVDPIAIKEVITAVGGIKQLRYGFRPGSGGKIGTPTTALTDDQCRKFLLFPTPAVVQAAVLYAISAKFDLDVEFNQTPLIADPVSNTFLFSINADVAAVFDDQDLQVRVWYKWVKASQANQSSYLGWEALG